MKKIKILKISSIGSIALALVINSCSNSSDDSATPPQNQAPEAFNLIAVADGATGVDVTPTFSWNTATDPDGDVVTYSLLLDNNSNPSNVVAQDISGTTFTLDTRLPLVETFFWKVIAKDNTGNTSQSSTFNFTTRSLTIPNTPVTTTAPFSARGGHTGTVFENNIWVIGGIDNTVGRKNDVWRSNDGISWTEITAAAPFSARTAHTTVVFDNKLWVIGGSDDPFLIGRKNDVWSSNNGSNWIEVTTTASFSARSGHTTVVFGDKLWVIGGRDDLDFKNDTWSRSSGGVWLEEATGAPFSARAAHTTTVFNNKIWLIGGRDNMGLKNDVWSSLDGITWTQINVFAPFSARSGHTTIVFDNKLWVIGGVDTNGERNNDIWSSSDGSSWTEVTETVPFSARESHTTMAFDNKIWLIGGFDSFGLFKNDVWSMD